LGFDFFHKHITKLSRLRTLAKEVGGLYLTRRRRLYNKGSGKFIRRRVLLEVNSCVAGRSTGKI